jgi:hypothetical protein
MVPNMWFHTNINGRKGTNYVSIDHWLFIDCSLMIHWSWINYWYPLILFNIHISIPHIFPYGGRDSQRYFKLRSADPWAKNAIPGLWKIPWIDFNKWLIAPKTLWGDPPSGRVFSLKSHDVHYFLLVHSSQTPRFCNLTMAHVFLFEDRETRPHVGKAAKAQNWWNPSGSLRNGLAWWKGRDAIPSGNLT